MAGSCTDAKQTPGKGMPSFTKNAIKTAFMELLNERPLNKITVKDIVEKCGINRNSFYYHFQDVPSLIEEIVMEEADRLLERYPTINTLDECFNAAFAFAMANKKAMLHIYNSVNRDIYEHYLMKICGRLVTIYIDTVLGRDERTDERDRAILIRFIQYELFGAYIGWMSSGMEDNVIEDLHRLLALCKDILEEIIRRSVETRCGG